MEGAIALGRTVRKRYATTVTLKLAKGRSGGTAFQVEGLASAKALS